MEQDLLTTKLLARRWQIAPRTLERWRAEGEGPRYMRIGRHIRYRKSDILAFEAEQIAAADQQQALSPEEWFA